MLAHNPAGATAYLDADLSEPGRIVTDPQLTEVPNLKRYISRQLFGTLNGANAVISTT